VGSLMQLQEQMTTHAWDEKLQHLPTSTSTMVPDVAAPCRGTAGRASLGRRPPVAAGSATSGGGIHRAHEWNRTPALPNAPGFDELTSENG